MANDMIGTCQRCRIEIGSASFKFCSACSRDLEICYFCNREIKDGNFYIKKMDDRIAAIQKRFDGKTVIPLETILQDGKEDPDSKKYSLDEMMASYEHSELKGLEKRRDELKGKSRYELMMRDVVVSREF